MAYMKTITILHTDNSSPCTAVKFRINTPNHHDTVIINNNDATYTVLHADDTVTFRTADQLAKLFTDYPTLKNALDTPAAL